jgi:hypothetical protein
MSSTLSAQTARSLLPNIKISEADRYISHYDYSSDKLPHFRKLFYLGYQCCRGDYNLILDFIQGIDKKELVQLLNDNTLYEFYNGTVLHLATYWNPGDNGIKLYNLLVEHGAVPSRNDFDMFPWEQNNTLWVSVILRDSIGKRDPNEFASIYESITP